MVVVDVVVVEEDAVGIQGVVAHIVVLDYNPDADSVLVKVEVEAFPVADRNYRGIHQEGGLVLGSHMHSHHWEGEDQHWSLLYRTTVSLGKQLRMLLSERKLY